MPYRNSLFFIFLAGAALNFLPYFLGYSLKDSKTGQYPDYMVALSGFNYGASIVASLATTIPILVDFGFDMLITAIYKENKVTQNPMNINVPFREIVLLLIIPDALLLFWILPYAQYDLVAPLICARDTMFTFCFLSCMVKFENRIWTQWTTIMIGGPLMIANAMVSCAALVNDGKFQASNRVITPFLISAGLLYLTTNLIRWYIYMFNSNEKKIATESFDTDGIRAKTDFFCTFFCTLLGIFLYGDWILFYLPLPTSSPWSVVGSNYLSMYNYLMAGCTLCMIVVINRYARLDAVETRNILRVKQLFMRYISHELRTPLNIAFLGLKILFDDLVKLELPDLLQTVKDTQESCLVAVDILNDMLLYDHISSGVMILQKKSFDPIPFLIRAIKPFRTQAREAGVELRMQQNIQADSPYRLLGDLQKLAQVIRNLLSNALKFTERGGSVSVSISIQQIGEECHDDGDDLNNVPNRDIETGGFSPSALRYAISGFSGLEPSHKAVTDTPKKLVLTVTDSGIGIPQERISSLFDGVIQFTPGVLEKGQGTGLGLYISKQIVDQHGGSISVHSEGRSRGSTFVVSLPLFLSARGEGDSGPSDRPHREDGLGFVPCESPTTADFMMPISSILCDNHEVSSRADSQRIMPPNKPLFNENSVLMSVESDEEENEPSQVTGNNALTNTQNIAVAETNKSEGAASAETLSALVVDDSAMNRRMVCKILQSSGQILCDQAENGVVAVEMVRRKKQNSFTTNRLVERASFMFKYNLILMDFQMPDMDGPTAIAEIRRLGYSGIILGLTGNVLQADKDTMIAAGADGVLAKPLNIRLFWDTIHRLSVTRRKSIVFSLN